jgi:hypothetical protein
MTHNRKFVTNGPFCIPPYIYSTGVEYFFLSFVHNLNSTYKFNIKLVNSDSEVLCSIWHYLHVCSELLSHYFYIFDTVYACFFAYDNKQFLICEDELWFENVMSFIDTPKHEVHLPVYNFKILTYGFNVWLWPMQSYFILIGKSKF